MLTSKGRNIKREKEKEKGRGKGKEGKAGGNDLMPPCRKFLTTPLLNRNVLKDLYASSVSSGPITIVLKFVLFTILYCE